MMLPKEIRQEAAKYASGDRVRLEAFIAGAMFATTGKYYLESEIPSEETFVERIPTFDEFWNAYSYKKGRKKASEKWSKLKDADKIACMKAVPLYVENSIIPGTRYTGQYKPYRVHPLTYLNGARWEDEIYPTQNYEQQRTIQLASKAARILAGSNNQG